MTTVRRWVAPAALLLVATVVVGPGARDADAVAAVRVNIWRDAEAAAFVREHNGGDEVVPTVLVGDETWTDPEPARVRAVLGSV